MPLTSPPLPPPPAPARTPPTAAPTAATVAAQMAAPNAAPDAATTAAPAAAPAAATAAAAIAAPLALQAAVHLQLEQLGFGHAGAPPLFSGRSASLAAGVTWVQGDTGCGKTTLLQLLAGRLRPQQGRLRLIRPEIKPLVWPDDGDAWQAQVMDSDAAWLHLPDQTAATIAQRLAQLHPGFEPSTWATLLDGFSLGPHLAKPMLALSTGSRRKLRLAAALSANAPLTLLDEPAAGLDAPALRLLQALLAGRHAAARQVTVVAGGLGPDAACAPVALPVLTLPFAP